ncbi:MAG: hypothetical protein PHT62_06475 [Desulfotomaculaceae bacterium]|nr:hypothetical protein [Desulfotomaculaceae bacterium]
MNGFKYLTCTAVSMIAVLLGFIVVLSQFNLMVYPSCITAFSINTGEKGVCQIEFLGGKAQLTMPNLEVLNSWGVQSHQMLTEKAYQALERGGKAAMQVRDARFKALPLEEKLEQLLTTFETDVLFPVKERLQRDSGYGR